MSVGLTRSDVSRYLLGLCLRLYLLTLRLTLRLGLRLGLSVLLVVFLPRLMLVAIVVVAVMVITAEETLSFSSADGACKSAGSSQHCTGSNVLDRTATEHSPSSGSGSRSRSGGGGMVVVMVHNRLGRTLDELVLCVRAVALGSYMVACNQRKQDHTKTGTKNLHLQSNPTTSASTPIGLASHQTHTESFLR
jgi:hypothetical protein